MTKGMVLFSVLYTATLMILAACGSDPVKTPLISIPVGSDRNHIKHLNKLFNTSDLEIIADDGSVIRNGDSIRVTGEMTGTGRAYCNLQVEKIEKPVKYKE